MAAIIPSLEQTPIGNLGMVYLETGRRRRGRSNRTIWEQIFLTVRMAEINYIPVPELLEQFM